MKFQFTGRKDLFGVDAGVFGWPSDGLDDLGAAASDLYTADARPLRRQRALAAPLVQTAQSPSAEVFDTSRSGTAGGQPRSHADKVDTPRRGLLENSVQ